MRLARVLVVFVGISVGGCTSINQMYPGPKRPEPEVSIFFAPNKTLVFLSMDGARLKEGPYRTIVHALPGKHTFVLGYQMAREVVAGTPSAGVSVRFGEPLAVEVAASGGHYYRLTPVPDDQAKTWRVLVDDTTDKRHTGEIDGIVSDSGY